MIQPGQRLPELVLDLIQIGVLRGQRQLGRRLRVFQRLDAQPLYHRQSSQGNAHRWQRRRLAAHGLALPVHFQGLLQDIVEQLAHALVFCRLPGLHELADFALGAGAHLLHHLGLLDEQANEQAQIGSLHVIQRLLRGWVLQDGANALAHVRQLALPLQLLVEVVKHPPFLGVEQVGMPLKQLLHHRASVVLRAQNGLAQGAIRCAPRVFDAPKVLAQAAGQGVHLPNALDGLLLGQHLQLARLHLFELLLQLLYVALQVFGAALRVGI